MLLDGWTFDLPTDFNAQDIAAGTVWGIFRDELGVETVRGYQVPAKLRSGCKTHSPD